MFQSAAGRGVHGSRASETRAPELPQTLSRGVWLFSEGFVSLHELQSKVLNLGYTGDYLREYHRGY